MKFLYILKIFFVLLTFSSCAWSSPILQACPSEVRNLPEGTTCWAGKDEAGAYHAWY